MVSKTLFLFMTVCALFFNVQAQKMEPVAYPEKQPEFPGGVDELERFLLHNIIYPKEAQEKGMEEVVLINFIVEEDGSLSNIKLSDVKRYDWGFGEEAVRVVNMMPKWVPGQLKGVNVRTRYTIPVIFSLDGTSGLYSMIQGKKTYRFFSTGVVDDKTDGFFWNYKIYDLKLYQDGTYEMNLFEARSHKMSYDDKIGEGTYSDGDDMEVSTISEGNYIESEQALLLMDENSPVRLEYHWIYDVPICPNKVKIRWIPVQTLPFLDNIHFAGDL